MTGRKSSTESSMSQLEHNLTDNEHSNESEFEEHDYCLQNEDKVTRKKMFSDILDGKFSTRNNGLTIIKRKPKCNSKNAVTARINRLKKKKYINNLETSNAELEAENKALKNLLNRQIKENHSLKREALNLRNVIRNRTEIGSLLKCIHLNTNLQISSSLLNDMSKYSQDNTSETLTPVTISNEQPAFIEEGNGGHNDFFNSSTNSQIPIMGDIKDNVDFRLDTTLNQSYCKFKNEISNLNQSELLSENNLEREFVNSDTLLRCETPSRGFDDFYNEENLFVNSGVCFHIANSKVSLEFCDTCNLNAAM